MDDLFNSALDHLRYLYDSLDHLDFRNLDEMLLNRLSGDVYCVLCHSACNYLLMVHLVDHCRTIHIDGWSLVEDRRTSMVLL